MTHPLQTVLDVCVLCVIAAVFTKILPAIAVVLGIVYHIVMLWPSAKSLWRRIRRVP